MVGLSDPVGYGEPVVNTPVAPVIDESALSNGPNVAFPPVLLRDVEDPVPAVRLATEVIILDGSGDGMVDAASAGLIQGDEAVLLAAEVISDDGSFNSVPVANSPPRFIVTDSHRDRSEQWRSSQDSVGMTESGGAEFDTTGDHDDTHEPLPRPGDGDSDAQTIAVLDGELVVQASSYGEPFALLPEARPAMAVDGDPATAWQVGTNASPIGESITISDVADGQLQLVQVQGRERRNWITSVAVSFGDESSIVVLDERSLGTPGQTIEVPAGTPVTVTIETIAERPNRPETGDYWVGFAELGPVATEFVRPPTLVLDQLTDADDIGLVFRRERTDPTDRWRSDPESNLARRFELPVEVEGSWSVRVRLNRRASDAVLNQVDGTTIGPTSADRLIGVPEARATSAFDGDPDTAWTSPFHAAIGSSLTIPLDATSAFNGFDLVQPIDDLHSTIIEVGVQVGAVDQIVTVPAPDAEGRSHVSLPDVSDEELVLTVTDINALVTIDRRYGDPATLPVSLQEIEGLPVVWESAEVVDVCRTDLLSIDGVGVPLLVDSQLLLSGEPVDAQVCAGAPTSLTAGTHELVSASGRSTGIDVDLVSFAKATDIETEGGVALPPNELPLVTVKSSSLTSMGMTVPPCPDGCWLIFGQGHSDGWEAQIAGTDLGVSTPISGGFNGWWLEPSDSARSVDVSFAPQSKVRLGLLISLLSVAACVLCVAYTQWRRRGVAPEPLPDTVSPLALSLSHLMAPVTRRRAAVDGVLLVAASLILIGPEVFVHAVVAAVALVASRRPRLVALGGVGLLAAIGLNVARREWVYDYATGAGWPARFGDLHEITAFAIMVIAVSVVTGTSEELRAESEVSESDVPSADSSSVVVS